MPWYYKTWFVVLMIIVFFPVGLVLMWKSPAFGTKTRVIVTAIFALLIAFAPKPDTTTTRSTVPQTTAKPAPAPAPKQYATVSANEMMGDLERNAAAAQQKYKGKLICVIGRVGVIDSNGDYILVQSDNQFAINGVMCHLKSRDEAQKNFLLGIQVGQYIKAYGEINDVGEVLGYTLKVDKFELYQ